MLTAEMRLFVLCKSLEYSGGFWKEGFVCISLKRFWTELMKIVMRYDYIYKLVVGRYRR